jgi:hypothetical protein
MSKSFPVLYSLIVLMCVLINNRALSQEISIEVENSDKLYAGYPCQVKIKVDNVNPNTIKFKCEGCERFNSWNPDENTFALIAKDTSFVIISYQDPLTNKTHKKEIPVSVFGLATVTLDGLSNQTTLRKIPKTIELDYDPGKSNYRPSIVKVKYEMDGKSFFSFGDELNKEVLKQMTANRKGVLNMIVYYYNVKFEMVTAISEFNYDLD